MIAKSAVQAAAIRHAVPNINNALVIPSIHCSDIKSTSATTKTISDVIKPVQMNAWRTLLAGDNWLLSSEALDQAIVFRTGVVK
jgi:hypothetical protein